MKDQFVLNMKTGKSQSFEAVVAERDTLRATIEAKDAEIAGLNEPYVCQGCAEYSLEIEAKDAEIDRLRRERNGWKNSATTEAEDRKVAKDRADAAEARVKDYQDACSQKQEIINSHAVVEAHYRDDIAGRDTVILRLESELSSKDEEVDSLSQQLAEAKKDTARLVDALTQIKKMGVSFDARETQSRRVNQIARSAIDEASVPKIAPIAHDAINEASSRQ